MKEAQWQPWRLLEKSVPCLSVFRFGSDMSVALFIHANHTSDIFRMIVFLRAVLSSLERWENEGLGHWRIHPAYFMASQKQERDMNSGLPNVKLYVFPLYYREQIGFCLQNLIIHSGCMPLHRVKGSEAYWTLGK